MVRSYGKSSLPLPSVCKFPVRLLEKEWQEEKSGMGRRKRMGKKEQQKHPLCNQPIEILCTRFYCGLKISVLKISV